MGNIIKSGLDELGNAIHSGIEKLGGEGKDQAAPPTSEVPATADPDCNPIYCEGIPEPAQS